MVADYLSGLRDGGHPIDGGEGELRQAGAAVGAPSTAGFGRDAHQPRHRNPVGSDPMTSAGTIRPYHAAASASSSTSDRSSRTLPRAAAS